MSYLRKLIRLIVPPASKQEKVLKNFYSLVLRKPRLSLEIEESSISDYEQWILANEPTEDALALQTQKSQLEFNYSPLISVVTPVFDTDPQHLIEMILSVQKQSYTNWELCIADGKSTNEDIRSILGKFASEDNRIKVAFLDKNLGISGNSNAALHLAHGEFIALLDHDDLLSREALFEIVSELNKNQSWDVLYSDHDVLSFEGSLRSRPLFKPDWSPEILLSANYMTHLTVLRKSLVESVSGFDSELDGAQDWDLFFKISEKTQMILHIPKILYHWRNSYGSTATDIWAKPYAPPAQLRAIQHHLNRIGLTDPNVYFDESGFIRVEWSILIPPMVSIIIPSNGANDLLERCVDSILKRTSYSKFEVVIVNNGPRKPDEFAYYQKVSLDNRVKIVHHDKTFNYSAVNNFGALNSIGDVLVFLNNDTEVIKSDWLDEFAMWTSLENIGIVGAKLLRPDNTIQHAGVIIGLSGFAGHIFAGLKENYFDIFGCTEWYRNYSAVTAACLGIRRNLFERLGGFDEEFILCGSDVEICLRAQKVGFKVVYNPFIKLIHKESATRDGTIPAKDFYCSFEHYEPLLRSGDPYFNHNLSYWSTVPSIRKEEIKPLDFATHYIKSLSEITYEIN